MNLSKIENTLLLSGFFPATLSPGSRTHKHVTSSVSEKRELRETLYTTVDGRIPAPVDMVNIPDLQGFLSTVGKAVLVISLSLDIACFTSSRLH